MIEATFAQYGLLGLVCFTLMSIIVWQQKKDDFNTQKLMKVIENNTKAMTRFAMTIRKCKR